MLDLTSHPHRRFNPLTREWVLVSPQRTRRPWQGQMEKLPEEQLPSYVPDCYLCPGNHRAGGKRNPNYADTFVFENDFPALLPDTAIGVSERDGLLLARSERGLCRVVCFSPQHDLTLSRMEPGAIRKVVDTWIGQHRDLAAKPIIHYVQIFENRGAMMGCSNPHPHCQIWGNSLLPNEVTKEDAAQREYFESHGSRLLDDYLRIELEAGERIVLENDHFVVLVPFWAIWPFETLLLAREGVRGIDELSNAQRDGLADALKRITTRYDNLFETPFPYSMGFHQRPTDGGKHNAWSLHAHFYPPLLRSAAVKKFMVGYEMLGSPQRDITAESAAQRLRDVSETHYAERDSRLP